ncbi:MAG: LON peptidase substrate-binding domain-containing protein [Anaerolineales bacterium]|nr:LON peptidase substrate-binding domain-containing protein [Anaerolineales bacterium]
MMFELPLFPLNTVLFPGAPLRLHIFEERYKRMIGACIQEGKPFGVVLIQQGAEALGPPADPHPVGCSAKIAHVQRLEDGHMNIVILGQERFRIFTIDRVSQPYLVGVVDHFPLLAGAPEALSQAGQRLRPWVERFIQALLEAGDVQFDLQNLPDEPVALAYLAASILQIPADQKQELLALRKANELLSGLEAIYRREAAFLEILLSKREGDQGIPFSRN